MKLLVLEDTRAGSTFLKGLLQENGLEVEVRRNGREGLDFLKENSVDCVLTDLLMPEMDGMQFLEAIKDMENRPVTIVITSSLTQKKIEKCKELGAAEVLSKPYKEKEIIETIHSFVK